MPVDLEIVVLSGFRVCRNTGERVRIPTMQHNCEWWRGVQYLIIYDYLYLIITFTYSGLKVEFI